MRQLFLPLFVLLTACATPYSGSCMEAALLYKDRGLTRAELDSLARLGLHDEQRAAMAWVAFEAVDSFTIDFVARCDGLPDNAGGPVQEGTITLSSLSAGGQPRVKYQLRAHSFDGWLDGGEDVAREENGQYVFGAPPIFREVVLSWDRTVLGARTSFWPCRLQFVGRDGLWDARSLRDSI